MTVTASPCQRSLLSRWLQAARPFTFTASMVPVFFAAAYAVFLGLNAMWVLFPLIAIASLLIHASTNLVNEYYDFIKNVDRPDSLGGSRVLVEGLLSPRHVFIGGLIGFALTAAIGLIFIILRGAPILALGLAGILAGIFYTASPAEYKYWGLGDFMVFLFMGPLMVIGAFFVLTGTYLHSVLLTSLPIGCLVAAILSGNNLRDIPFDEKANIKTTACLLGHKWAKIEYALLVLSAFAIAFILIMLELLPAWSFAVFITLPLAIKVVRQALANRIDSPHQLIAIDMRTAQLHLAFGLLLIISVLLGAFL